MAFIPATQGPIIPHTSMRLKPYITIMASQGGVFLDKRDVVDFNTKLQNTKLVVIGAVEKLTITQDRPVNNYRELNVQFSGKPMEVYPGLPTYKLTMHRVVLNESDLQEAFGFHGGNLIEQFAPVIIRLDLAVPIKPDGSKLSDKFPARTFYFPGCWFDKNPLEFDVTSTDLKIIQEVTAQAVDVIEQAA